MILKMKKYAFLVYHRQYVDFLEKIRNLGVLHVIERPEGVAENDLLRDKMKFSSRVKIALKRIEKRIPKNSILAPADTTAQGLEILTKVENALLAEETLDQKMLQLEKDREHMEVWGSFSHKRLVQLKNAGFVINFYSCNASKFDQEWEVLYNAFEIDTVGSTRYFITITRPGQVIEIDADPVKLSHKTALEIEKDIDANRALRHNLKAELVQMSIRDYNTLKWAQDNVQETIDFSKALLNTKSEVQNTVMLLEGWCPEEKVAGLNALLENEGIFYEAYDPDVSERVPIVLNNNSFSKLFEPITNLFSLPNYTELDPTPFFAPFFMLFFGLCLGDGGYGLLIWAVCTVAKRRMKPDMRGLLTLGQYLGIATVAVGVLTGSFFGIALDKVQWEWLAGVKQYFITQDNYGPKLDGYNPMMFVAIVIGIIQILFGMMVNVLKINKQHGFKYAAGHLAWVVFIVSTIIYLGMKAFGYVAAPAMLYLLYGFMALSVLCIVFYNSPGKGVGTNMGSALWNTYNMATGLLGDTLSYIRLFALGLTGSILGGVFNTLAFDLTVSMPGYSRWLAVLLILLIGHSINFALCLIGAFVHPLRLTFVEFYKNAGFEGGGKAYKPLKKNI